jgi:phage terminase large subunit GpA-like protein
MARKQLMRRLNKHQLERYLAREVLGREIPRKPPASERRGPARDADYRRWVRTLPCLACHSRQSIEAAHTGQDGGMSMKASDYSCIPLCSNCHTQGPQSYHRIGRAAFERARRVSCAGECARLVAEWRAGAA